ncbi:hypothetical protein CH249_01955 [Rhodococcus sp. 05-2255-3B1]|nr:hypothetical protein CH250_05410 [Rhodococcus sp. 05-2255-3C]OZE16035.1 hypothetical protein CH249_01955 [Rhodococcus sp. 05-2255-3B1]OZE19075.1 hypothetical protein CH255_13980 [Rhodococcus sp. 05-2255-2A2]
MSAVRAVEDASRESLGGFDGSGFVLDGDASSAVLSVGVPARLFNRHILVQVAKLESGCTGTADEVDRGA